MIGYLLAIISTLLIGLSLNSCVRIISGSDEAIVERLGKYARTLKPGLQIVLPVIEKIVHYDTTRERMIDIPPQDVLTKDSIPLTIDAAVYWKIDNLQKSYYDVEKIDQSMADIVHATLRAEVGQRTLSEMLSALNSVNQALLQAFDDVTLTWGIKVLRVSIQTITPPKSITDAQEKEKAAASIMRAEELEANSQAKFIEVFANALNLDPSSPEFIKYLIAKQYIEVNEKLSESDNSKIIFMHPDKLTEEVINLMEQGTPQPPQIPPSQPTLELVQPKEDPPEADESAS